MQCPRSQTRGHGGTREARGSSGAVGQVSRWLREGQGDGGTAMPWTKPRSTMEREADSCALNSHQLTVTILSSCFVLKGLIRTIKYALSTGNSAGLVFGNRLCMQHHLNPL